ncbi:hypothetical protein SAMN05444280_14126 [Tangfeifania diversioriginum]|uniref:DUF973 family protein n=1 Tax=Tangfeifania diversioriginum TaxID=1168035 RepID=A0A1M6NCJ9_9BACT|nr:hypothetical protein [Tangfeifania diversioriginum]SHJ93421.1 hypothetical protein SAMN05444280_14126 [Tangfeifania diversioriginum]
MKTTENYLAEIKEIRKMMEESSRFLSLSGLSGVLVGIYALLGAFMAESIIYTNKLFGWVLNKNVLPDLLLLAAIVLVLSLVTVILLTWRKARKGDKKIWNPGSRLMLINLAIPIISGGILILIFLFNGIYEIAAPGSLIFYGLALVNAAKFTRQEIFQLGIFQISLGILAALLPSLGLLFWALGFGAIHIIYGALMYFRYERTTNK